MCRIVIVSVIALVFSASTVDARGGRDTEPGSRVQVVSEADGTFTLLRNGQPYRAKGAGTGSGEALAGASLEVLAASGGNSIRTWGTEQLEHLLDGKPLLDRAHELGLSVAAGFWVEHVRHGFDYSDPESIERQRKKLRDAVLKHKDHPALLVWLLGNEMEAFEPNVEAEIIWKELNHLAGIIKELDPHHPVATVIAGATAEKIAGIREHFPNLDILGINAYSSAPLVGKSLPGMGWEGPYMLTEFGVAGTWEVQPTSWDAPVEPDPSAKAVESYTAYTMNRDDNVGRSLGSYVFFWGNKQEATATWYGMFLESGEKLPRVDAMAYAWTGEWPDNRAPKLHSLETPIAFERIAPGSSSYAEADIVDREGDELTYVWDIRAESSDRRIGGDAEAAPPSFPEAIEDGQGTPRISFKVPERRGGYRIFVTAYDGQGGAVVHNVPFYVEE
ncbi:MAG: glycoside hydrolase family 2 TIM barrel-domain containing protein [Woeseiaceae bacterium]|nr:glycoside hydrolase family 2 TIM barrel-domain containing protein [Woeseiaceae bacterium]